MKKLILSVLFILLLSTSFSNKIMAEDSPVSINSENELIDLLSTKDNVKVTLANDLQLTKTLVIDVSKTLTLYLNEHTIQTVTCLNDDINGIEVKGIFNLYDKEDGTTSTGTITANSHLEGDDVVMARLVYVYDGATFNMYGGNLTKGFADYCGGGVYNCGTFNLYNGTISGCGAMHSAGNVCNKNVFNMYDGLITLGDAHVGGGIYCLDYSKTNIYGGKVTKCSAGESGAGIFGCFDVELNIIPTEGKTVEITDNSAAYIGGGIALSPDSKVKLIGNILIVRNMAPFDAGIANGTGPDNLEIGGKLIVIGNMTDTTNTAAQSNIGILSDSTIIISPPLLSQSEIGFHMSDLSTGNTIISSGANGQTPDVPTADIRLLSDFNSNNFPHYKGNNDYLFVEDDKLIIDLTVFTVTFNTKGGSEVPTQKVKRGRYLEQFPDPTKEGFEFGGWYTEEDGSFDPYMMDIKQDMELIAKWDYQILKGKNSIWHQGDNDEVEIICNGPFEKFKSLSINYMGEITAEEFKNIPNYLQLNKTAEGYTSIIIKKALLNMFDVENYRFDLTYEEDMKANAILVVKEKEYKPDPIKPVPCTSSR